jgi:hypothetical protein
MGYKEQKGRVHSVRARAEHVKKGEPRATQNQARESGAIMSDETTRMLRADLVGFDPAEPVSLHNAPPVQGYIELPPPPPVQVEQPKIPAVEE